MAKFIEEFFYGNLDPQARSTNLNSPKIIQRYLKSSKIKQILRKLAKTA